MEFAQIPVNNSETIDGPQFQFGLAVTEFYRPRGLKGKLRQSLKSVRERNPPIKFRRHQPLNLRSEPSCEASPEPISEDHVLFATHGSLGVVDLCATKTVIGSNHVAELIRSLHPKIRNQLSRCPCQVSFPFVNHGTLKSEQALVVPFARSQLEDSNSARVNSVFEFQ